MSYIQQMLVLLRAMTARHKARALYAAAMKVRFQLEVELTERRREEFVAHGALIDADAAVMAARKKLGWAPEVGSA